MARQWHWSTLNEAGTVMGMRVLLLIHRLFGRFVFRLVLWPLMTYYFVRRRVAREASADFLAHIRRVEPDAVPRRLAGLKHFVAFGESILDKFLVWMGQIRREDVHFDNAAELAELDASHRGGVIIVSHLGNIEVCRALAYRLPRIRLTILVHTRHAAKFNALLARLAPDSPIDLMQVTEVTPATAMLLSERVEAGEYVVIAGDRTPVTGEQRISLVRFLGARAPLPQGPFILASLLRCPVHLMFCLKYPQGYRIYLEAFSERIVLPRKSRQDALDALLQRYAGRLEHYARLTPLQWFNFYPFWGSRSDSGNRQAVIDGNDGRSRSI